MTKLHAVITGSLHNGNMGDNALLRAFIDQHGDKYRKLTVLGASSQDLPSVDHNIFPPPHMAIGYRFWRGHRDRTKTKKMVTEQIPDAVRHYIWLGGLFGPNIYHARGRHKELIWSSSFCDTLLYYFGDVETKFDTTTEARKIVNMIDQLNVWLAVRSIEAAGLLIDAGLRSKIHVGIDAVLYDRCKRRGIPFARQKKDSGALAIVVCSYLMERHLPIWRAAAFSAIKYKLKILWVSLCDSEDLSLCKQLFKEFSEQNPKHPMEVVCGIDGESRIAEASICVATRLHGAIFSLTANVPTIAVPYAAKVQRLFDFLALEDWVINPNVEHQKQSVWNSIVNQMVGYVLEGKWQPDYTQLKAGIKTHEEALFELDLILRNSAALK